MIPNYFKLIKQANVSKKYIEFVFFRYQMEKDKDSKTTILIYVFHNFTY